MAGQGTPGWEKSVEDHPSWREDLWETPRNRTENKKLQGAMGVSQPAEDLGITRKVSQPLLVFKESSRSCVQDQRALMRPKRALTEVAGEKSCPRLNEAKVFKKPS